VSFPPTENGDGIVDESDLVVRVDDIEISHLSPSGNTACRYYPDSNEVDFSPMYLPQQRAVIRVSYLTCSFG